jgi:hypothetical protein
LLSRAKKAVKTGFALSVVGLMVFLALGLTAGAEAGLVGELEQISPNPTVYQLGVDFRVFLPGNGITTFDPFLGSATGLLQDAGTGGADEFGAFVAGNIALIKRGPFVSDPSPALFSTKAQNAADNGAIAAIIYDNDVFFPTVGLAAPTTIPAVFTTNALGLALLGQLQQGDAVIMSIAVVPEPSTVVLFSVGLLGAAAYSFRRRRGRK